MKVVIPDLVSNSYFPAIAAVEMGFFKEEGLDAELELIYPVGKCYEALRDGKADFVGGSSHSAPTAFPEWKGVKFLGALAQHTYWFLIMRADLNVKRGDVAAVKGKRIGAAPLIDIGLIELLKEYGIDPKRDNVQIAPPPMPASPAGVSFGVNAAKAMEEGKIDGFWANGMGAEVAVQARPRHAWCSMRGAATGPRACAATPSACWRRAPTWSRRTPDKAAAAVRALVKTQKALKADPKRATKVGEKWFPAFEASLIATLVERDLPYYDPAISKGTFDSMCKFVQTVGLTKGVGKYEDVVATQFSEFVEGVGFWDTGRRSAQSSETPVSFTASLHSCSLAREKLLRGFRRHRHDLHGLFLQRLRIAFACNHRVEFGAEPRNDRRGRAWLARTTLNHTGALRLGNPLSTKCRNVRSKAAALAGGHCERTQLARLDERKRGRCRGERHADTPREEIGHQRGRALVRHVKKLRAGLLREDRSREMGE